MHHCNDENELARKNDFYLSKVIEAVNASVELPNASHIMGIAREGIRMRPLAVRLFVALCLLLCVRGAALCSGQTINVGSALEEAIAHAKLTQPGSIPFHLKAVSAPAHPYNAAYSAEIEEYWVGPYKWRRTIRATDFEQTVV